MAFTITKAWTSMPCACASTIRSRSGSKPGSIGSAAGGGGGEGGGGRISARPSRESRYHESPRRRTCAKIAFAWATRACSTTATTCAWLLSPVLNVSTQNPRYCAGSAAAETAQAAAASDKAARR